MSFKNLSYLELWQPFCSAEQNYFGEECYEEQFSEIVLNLGQWFRRRCCLKDFLSGALVALLFGEAELKEGIMGNIHVKLYEIGAVVQEEMSFEENVYGQTR